MWKVQLFKLNYDEREAKAVYDVVKSGWITMGEHTKKFEADFNTHLQGKTKSVAVSSGTAALHMAMLVLDLKPGDEVIVPSLTFVADINVVRMAGAKPVLVDCTSYSDWNASPTDIAKKITPNTKAVMVVHYAGYPCDMDPIKKICKEHNLCLIEDASHAVGARYKGELCGNLADIACFSFFTNKNLSVGEGGMYVTADEVFFKKGAYLRSHGMNALTLDRHQGRAISYDVMEPGLNYRIDEMRAALGCIQLDKLASSNIKRKELTQHYLKLLKGVKGFTIPFVDYPNTEPSYHIFPILLDKGVDRLKVIESLKNDGIQSSIHYPAFQEFTAYVKMNLNPTPIASDIANRELTLPLYPTMTFEEVELVVHSLKKAMEKNL